MLAMHASHRNVEDRPAGDPAQARDFTGLDGEWYANAHQSRLPCKGNIIPAQSVQLAHMHPTIIQNARCTSLSKANKPT